MAEETPGPSAAGARPHAPPPRPSLEIYRQQVQPLLEKYCYDCHGRDVQEADVRLDELDPDMIGGGDADHWDAALDMMNSGYMPPDDELQPSDFERQQIVDWVTASLDLATQSRTASPENGIRRLTREQYTHSLADLLGLPIDFGRHLPNEAKSKAGFTNSSDALLTSPLHVEYFQAIADAALSKAIISGDRPEPKRYRVTLGRNVGRGRHAAVIGGYQSAPLPREHVLVEILGESGQPRVGKSAEEEAELRGTEENIGIGMRGSSSDRYRIVDDGLVLFSAVPHKEQAPKSWQGPSPNMKLLLRQCFPSEGPFVARVTASLASNEDGNSAEGLIELRTQEPVVQLDADTGSPVLPTDSMVLHAKQCRNLRQLVLQGDSLVPQDITKRAFAKFELNLPDAGLYQIDMVHPAASADAMPSVTLRVDGTAQHLRLAAKDAGLDGVVVTPLAHAQLAAGKHALTVGGKFFVGFRQIVISPLHDEHAISVAIRHEQARNRIEFEDRTAALRAFVGNRTDDGMEYAEFGRPVEVVARYNKPATYEFRGYLENLPIPILDETERGELSNIMILGVWNDHMVKESADRGVPILIRSIEFEGPSYPEWPPASHTRIFFDSPLREIDRNAYTRTVIERFMSRAFRRKAEPAEVDRYFNFWCAQSRRMR